MPESGRVRLGGHESVEGGHTDEIGIDPIEGRISTFADVRAKVCKEGIDMGNAFLSFRTFRCARLDVKMLRQAVDLIGAKDAVSLHEGNALFDLLAVLVSFGALDSV
ncbi:MAG: hypothetical protein E5X98_27705, partial [Mesorhizobium sp.]